MPRAILYIEGRPPMPIPYTIAGIQSVIKWLGGPGNPRPVSIISEDLSEVEIDWLMCKVNKLTASVDKKEGPDA